MTAASRFLVIILVVLGVLALAAGIIYYVEPARFLPAFFPGHAAHLNGRHTTRGLAGIIAGAVLLIIAVITARRGRRSSRYAEAAARTADGGAVHAVGGGLRPVVGDHDGRFGGRDVDGSEHDPAGLMGCPGGGEDGRQRSRRDVPARP